MNKGTVSTQKGFKTGLGVALLTTALWALCKSLATAEEVKTNTAAPPPKQAVPAPKKAEPKAKKKLSGAELYSMNCNRCHPERYAPERTEAQWQTILLHMRTRANIPAEDARTILKFLQENSGK